MMQSLHVAVVVAPGVRSSIAAGLHGGRIENKTVSGVFRSACVSQRAMEKRIVMKLHHLVQVSWSAHTLASPLHGVTIRSRSFRSSEVQRSWRRSVALPSREHLEPTSGSQTSSHPSKEVVPQSLAVSEVQDEGHSKEKNLESDQIVFQNGRWLETGAEKMDFSCASSVEKEDSDPGDRRKPSETSSNTENATQAGSDKIGVEERERGENEVMGGNGDTVHDAPVGRKRMRRSKRKKKKASGAGIATYDSHTNTVRFKEFAAETPTVVHGKDIKQQRQSSFRSGNDEGAGANSESDVGLGTEVAGNRSTGKSLGVEEATRPSRLLGLEKIDSNDQWNQKLVTEDDAPRKQSSHGRVVQQTIESNMAAPSQAFVADGSEVALKRKPVKKLPFAQETSNTKVFDQPSESGKCETRPKNVDVQASTSNEVDPRKEITGNYQTTGRGSEQIHQARSNAFVTTESAASTADQVADSRSSTGTQVTGSVALTAAKFSSSLKDEVDSEDEFEESTDSDRPEFRGLSGLRNYVVLQEDEGVLVKLRDFYSFMMKKPLPEFAMGMMAAPLALSLIFTLLYLPEFQGLAYDETARNFLSAATGMDGAIGLELSWMTIFQVFMFSLSLSTGLEPDLAPLSPYTLVVANINALFAQLILAFLSAAVFARLSQPSEPVRCSSVALICAHNKRRGRRGEALEKVLLTRCVLAGPQPCELVNVKVDLTYRFNTVSSEGLFFRGSYPLKLVRSQIALLDQGMLVRHIIDERSPVYSRTPEMLRQDDAIFVLSVAGLERSSMQPIFHVQFYSVCDEQVIWDAEFEDMILINKKNQRVVDHSKLSSWKPL